MAVLQSFLFSGPPRTFAQSAAPLAPTSVPRSRKELVNQDPLLCEPIESALWDGTIPGTPPPSDPRETSNRKPRKTCRSTQHRQKWPKENARTTEIVHLIARSESD